MHLGQTGTIDFGICRKLMVSVGSGSADAVTFPRRVVNLNYYVRSKHNSPVMTTTKAAKLLIQRSSCSWIP
jgi:hypothetical protein